MHLLDVSRLHLQHLVVSCRRCAVRCSRPGPRTLRCCMLLEVVVTALTWLLALCFVALVAVYLTWVVLVYVSDGEEHDRLH